MIETISLSQGRCRSRRRAGHPIQLAGIDLRGRLDLRRGAASRSSRRIARHRRISKLAGTGEVPFKGRYDLDIEIEVAASARPRAPRSRPSPNPSPSSRPRAGSLVLSGEKDEIGATGQLDWPGREARSSTSTASPSALDARPNSTISARLEVRELARDSLPALGDRRPSSTPGSSSSRRGLLRRRSCARRRTASSPRTAMVSLVGVPETTLRFAARRFDLARAWSRTPRVGGLAHRQGKSRDPRPRPRLRSPARSRAHARVESRDRRARSSDRAALRAKLAGDSIELAELDVDEPDRTRARARPALDGVARGRWP